MKFLSALIVATLLLAVPFGPALTAADLEASGLVTLGGPKIIPTFVITAVQRDNYVEIQTDNFPSEDHFTVTMGPMGTRGVGGIVIGTTYSGPGGRFTMKYDIPPALQGSYQVAIRLESPTSGYYAYNWFYNNTINAPAPTPPDPAPPGYSGHPVFSIASVDAGESVTITPSNFPANDSFFVRMNWMGTQGVAGTIVETVTTDSNGKLSNTTYDIPDFLENASQVAIRLESPNTGYFAYNWFYNNTTGGTPNPPDEPGYEGYPTFTIAAVERDKNITIAPSNFPPNDTFNVKMNWMGTQGIGGAIVDTVTTNANGKLSDMTYPIPDYLKGQTQISVRLESPTSQYYAYNFFFNTTYK